MKKDVLFFTNAQKILRFILHYPLRDFLEKEICRAVQVSKSGVNYALKHLEKEGFVFCNKRGKVCFYSLNYKNPVIRQLKVLQVVLELEPLCEILKDISSHIILFGSCCRGEDTQDSDIDLFIVGRQREEIESAVKRFRLPRKIQLIIRTPMKFSEMKKTEPDFYQQVMCGITLWEVRDEE